MNDVEQKRTLKTRFFKKSTQRKHSNTQEITLNLKSPRAPQCWKQNNNAICPQRRDLPAPDLGKLLDSLHLIFFLFKLKSEWYLHLQVWKAKLVNLRKVLRLVSGAERVLHSSFFFSAFSSFFFSFLTFLLLLLFTEFPEDWAKKETSYKKIEGSEKMAIICCWLDLLRKIKYKIEPDFQTQMNIQNSIMIFHTTIDQLEEELRCFQLK